MGAWRRPSASRPCRHVWVTACSWSACAPEQHPWRMLVDGGPSDTWPLLEARLAKLPKASRQIDVAVVTHVDSDHIGGFLPFVRSDFAHEQVRDFWFNGRQHLDGVSQHRAGRGPRRRADRRRRWRRTALEQGVRREADRHHGGRSRRGGGAAGRAAHHRALAGRRSNRHAREDVGHRAEEGARRDPRDRRSRSPCASWATWRSWQPSTAPRTTRCPTAAASGCSSSIAARAWCSPGTGSATYSPRASAPSQQPADSSGSRSTRSSCRTTAAAATSSRRCWPTAPARHYVFSSNGDTFHHPDDAAVARTVLTAPRGATLWFNYRNARTERWGDADLRKQHGYERRVPRGRHLRRRARAPGPSVAQEVAAPALVGR